MHYARAFLYPLQFTLVIDPSYVCVFNLLLVLVDCPLLLGVDPVLSCALLCSQRVNGAVCEYGLPAGLSAGAGEAV